MKKRTIRKRKIRRDCYSLDRSWIEWLHERLPVYLKDKDKFVDMEYRKFTYDDKTYTEKQLTEKLICLVNEAYANVECTYEEEVKRVDEILDIWGKLYGCMWW